MKKRVLSLLMVLSMVLTLLPVSAFATEEPTLSLTPASLELVLEDGPSDVAVAYSGDGELTAVSNKDAVATAVIDGSTLTVSPSAIGSATVTVNAAATTSYSAIFKNLSVTVRHKAHVSVSPASITLLCGSKTSVDVDYDGNGTLSVSSSFPSVATASIEGNTVTIEAKAGGSTKIIVNSSKTSSYAAGSTEISVVVPASKIAVSNQVTNDNTGEKNVSEYIVSGASSACDLIWYTFDGTLYEEAELPSGVEILENDGSSLVLGIPKTIPAESCFFALRDNNGKYSSIVGNATMIWAKQLIAEGQDITFDRVIGGGDMHVDATYSDAKASTMEGALVLTSVTGLDNKNSNTNDFAGTNTVKSLGGKDVGAMLSSLTKVGAVQYGVKGHVSFVEVETTSVGTYLSFNYAFASCEFDQSASFNDSFGLFVSKQDGEGDWSDYENIAKIPVAGTAVNIQNLLAAGVLNKNGNAIGSIGGVNTDIGGKNGRGYTPIYTAKTSVEKGQKVRVLFAISDISDTSYDSAVIIEAGSFGFGAPEGEPNYLATSEYIENLDPNTEYKIEYTSGSAVEVVTVTSDAKGCIPFASDSPSYDIWGKSIKICRKVSSDPESWTMPQRLYITQKREPIAPENPTVPTEEKYIVLPDCSSTKTSVSVDNYKVDQVYYIYAADNPSVLLKEISGETGNVVFSGLASGKDYIVKTSFLPTKQAPISNYSTGVHIMTKDMITEADLIETNYYGAYDEKPHAVSVALKPGVELSNVKITYYLNKNYTSPTNGAISFTDLGTYTVYYCVEADDHYNYCGTLTAEIVDHIPSSAPTTYTVPFEGDLDTVKITATIKGYEATVNSVSDEDIAKAGTGENVSINLSSIPKGITAVNIPKDTFVNVAASDADGLCVKMPNGTSVCFDKETLKAIAKQAKGDEIKLVITFQKAAENTLNLAQKDTISEMNHPEVLDAFLVSNGVRISDFMGGEAEVTATYKSEYPVRVWYVAEDGEKELVPSTYDGETASFTVSHFSHYVIELLDGSDCTCCPQDETCVYAPYNDANTMAWYHNGVHFCVENKYMVGLSANKFVPNGTLTRAQIVTILWNMEGQPVADYAMSFEDVLDDFWYTEAIRWAQSTGVVAGYDDASFGPMDTVTREQLATILMNYAKFKKYDVSVGEDTNILSYDDAIGGISQWAVPSMQWAVGSGIIVGIGNNLVAKGNASRAQAACMIQHFCENVAK